MAKSCCPLPDYEKRLKLKQTIIQAARSTERGKYYADACVKLYIARTAPAVFASPIRFAPRGKHLYASDFALLLGFLLYSVVWRKTTKQAIILDSLRDRILKFHLSVCVLIFLSLSCSLVIWYELNENSGTLFVFCNARLWGKETNMAVARMITCKIGLIWRHMKTLYSAPIWNNSAKIICRP